MKKRFSLILWAGIIFSVLVVSACGQSTAIKELYLKKEIRIPMRDGKKLYTAIYIPRDSSRNYPILLQRTPYSVMPYGTDKYRKKLGPSADFVQSGYIFVYQDVRGRFMSEGKYVNMRPYIEHKSEKEQIDESTDTYDTIEWLIKHLAHTNGRVGMWGISYPGFYTAMGIIDAHPALKAASPQAPIADWFIGDDMHHNGALSLTMAFNFFSVFGQPRPVPVDHWPKRFEHGTPDGWQFFINMGLLSAADLLYFHHRISFWDDLMQHPVYDTFWQKRNILPHLKNIQPAVLVVGGWYDAEDLYGTLHIYQRIEQEDKQNKNRIVMGPWFHGGWARSDGQRLGDLRFGSKTSLYYRQKIEFPFFEYYLKDRGNFSPAEATMFDGGANQWHYFRKWPPEGVKSRNLYLSDNQKVSWTAPSAEMQCDEFWSDPQKPVPFIDQITNTWGRLYMVADQRFAAKRPDVRVYQSEIVSDSLTVAGPITADLFISTTGTDADWVVKLIDVYPDATPNFKPNPCKIQMAGYQRLVRAEIFRSKFRNSYEHPEALQPSQITEIKFPLQDVFHTFLPGHRIMIQIQSSWFPLFDRNPQTFTNIYEAKAEDFHGQWHRLYHSAAYPSHLKLPVLKNE